MYFLKCYWPAIWFVFGVFCGSMTAIESVTAEKIVAGGIVAGMAAIFATEAYGIWRDFFPRKPKGRRPVLQVYEYTDV
jgi:hypothetical protein